jgi:hypothetical protein
MHNMMVEARCENGELKSESYYEYSDCIDDTASANENTDTGNIQQVGCPVLPEFQRCFFLPQLFLSNINSNFCNSNFISFFA